MSGAGERTADDDLRQFAADAIDLFLEYKIVHGYKQPDAAKQAILDVVKGSSAATLSAQLAESSARVRELTEIASGMAACVEAMNTNQAWFSRSRIAFTLRDSLRAWADKYAALSGGSAVPEETSHAK